MMKLNPVLVILQQFAITFQAALMGTTGKIVVEYDFNGSTMGYASYTIDPNLAEQTYLWF